MDEGCVVLCQQWSSSPLNLQVHEEEELMLIKSVFAIQLLLQIQRTSSNIFINCTDVARYSFWSPNQGGVE